MVYVWSGNRRLITVLLSRHHMSNWIDSFLLYLCKMFCQEYGALHFQVHFWQVICGRSKYASNKKKLYFFFSCWWYRISFDTRVVLVKMYLIFIDSYLICPLNIFYYIIFVITVYILKTFALSVYLAPPPAEAPHCSVFFLAPPSALLLFRFLVFEVDVVREAPERFVKLVQSCPDSEEGWVRPTGAGRRPTFYRTPVLRNDTVS